MAAVVGAGVKVALIAVDVVVEVVVLPVMAEGVAYLVF